MRPISDTELAIALSQTEVDQLKDGTPITVFWGGGNGPCEYVTRRSPYCKRTLAVYLTPHYRTPVDVGPLDFVGRGKMNTKVLINAQEQERSEERAESPDSVGCGEGAE